MAQLAEQLLLILEVYGLNPNLIHVLLLTVVKTIKGREWSISKSEKCSVEK